MERVKVAGAYWFADTDGLSREEWLKLRSLGIGSSDAAAIANMSKWASPLSVYLEKIGAKASEDNESEVMEWGNRLEPVIADAWSEKTGFKISNSKTFVQHIEKPYLLANVDRWICDDHGNIIGILEIKNSMFFKRDEWEGDEVPPAYYIQVQHQLMVTGLDMAYIAYLLGGSTFNFKRIERDEEIINYLMQIETDFWTNHVETKTPPLASGIDEDALKELYPSVVQTEPILLDSQAEQWLKQYDEYAPILKDAELKVEEAKNNLKLLLGDNAKALYEERKISWTEVKTNKLDQKKLKEEQPETYAKYCAPSSYRKFGIK